MGQVQMVDTLREWRESAEYWERHAQTIRTMFAPVTRSLIEDAGISEGDMELSEDKLLPIFVEANHSPVFVNFTFGFFGCGS